MADLVGYDGNGYDVGSRVEISPATNLWMRGARYGVVVGRSLTAMDRVRVKMDATGDRVYTGPEGLFRGVN